MIAQIHSILCQHERCIRVGRAHLQISHALIAATNDAAILRSQLLDPVVACSILLTEFLTRLRRERGRQWHGRRSFPLLMSITAGFFLWEALLLSTLGWFLASSAKETLQVRFDNKARLERLLARIGCHLGTIEIQLPPPHQACLLALLDNLLKEAAEHLHA